MGEKDILLGAGRLAGSQEWRKILHTYNTWYEGTSKKKWGDLVYAVLGKLEQEGFRFVERVGKGANASIQEVGDVRRHYNKILYEMSKLRQKAKPRPAKRSQTSNSAMPAPAGILFPKPPPHLTGAFLPFFGPTMPLVQVPAAPRPQVPRTIVVRRSPSIIEARRPRDEGHFVSPETIPDNNSQDDSLEPMGPPMPHVPSPPAAPCYRKQQPLSLQEPPFYDDLEPLAFDAIDPLEMPPLSDMPPPLEMPPLQDVPPLEPLLQEEFLSAAMPPPLEPIQTLDLTDLEFASPPELSETVTTDLHFLGVALPDRKPAAKEDHEEVTKQEAVPETDLVARIRHLERRVKTLSHSNRQLRDRVHHSRDRLQWDNWDSV